MKPLKLKMKGINSFIEEQEIDFERLTKNNFFGIFGPTGSGKSTVLDGITLALYGDVARKSGNYINANVSSANVSYEFQISGAEKKVYRVEREFKLDAKSNKPRSGKCKIIEIREEHEEVLAEQPTNVTKKCEEIIGLKCDDFTRTVVLPQGKFSEFLSLKGKERNDMLERLFNLEQYGEELTSKLKRRSYEEESENRELQGQLNAYGEVEKSVFKEKQKELEEIKGQAREIAHVCKQEEEKVKEADQIRSLQHELEVYVQKQKNVELLRESIDKERQLVERAERADKTISSVQEWKKVQKKLEENTNLLVERQKLYETKSQELAKFEVEFNQIQSRNEELPALRQKEEKAKEALELFREIELLHKTINGNVVEKQELENQFKVLDQSLENCTKGLEEKKEALKQEQEKQTHFQVDLEFKAKVQEGLRIENNLIHIKEKKEDIQIKISQKEEDKKQSQIQKEKAEQALHIQTQEMKKASSLLEKKKENPPLSRAALQELYEKIVEFTGRWDSYRQYDKEQKECEQLIEQLNKQLKEDMVTRDRQLQEIEELEKEKHDRIMGNLAAELRRELADGEACPVCGSVYHSKEHIQIHKDKKEDNIDALLAEKNSQLTIVVQRISNDTARRDNNTQMHTERKAQIEALGNEFLKQDMTQLRVEYTEKKEALGAYEQDIQTLEEEMKHMNSQFNELNSQLIQVTTREEGDKQLLSQYKIDLNQVQEEFTHIEEEYKLLKQGISEETFASAVENINQKERDYRKLEEIITKLSNEITSMSEEKERITALISQNQNAYVLLNHDIKSMEEKVEEKQNAIYVRVGKEPDIKSHQENLSKEIKEIEDAFRLALQRNEELREAVTDIKNQFENSKEEKVKLESDLEERKEHMEQSLKKAQFATYQEVELAQLSDEIVVDKKRQIKEFEDQNVTNTANIKRVEQELGQRRLSDDEWSAMTERLIELKQKKEELEQNQSKLTFEVEELGKKLIEVEKIQERKKKIEKTISMLKELERLFKGKKFVQFIAAERLKYVSIAASETLMDISGGSYALLTNNSGEFVIKDYKNGGVEREISTLSGGETFLVSLSLALALSNQIQLTNDAPLELFFLDEGFGTLDDNLLEEVISALEKLQNSRRAIGLISHVTEIQNRVPIKLVVTPAKMGEHGSKVKILLS